MNKAVGTVYIDIKADTAKLVSGMNKAEKTVKRSVDNIKTAIISMVAAYAGIESVKAFTSMINDSLAAADATGKLAKKLGLTTEKLSEYQYAAGYAAISNSELNAGLSALIRRLNNFQRTGGGAAKTAFEELGITAEYARDNFTSTDIALMEILKRLEQLPDGYKKTAIAQDIFSKSASSLLRLTTSDIEKFSKEAQKIGISISQSTADMAGAYLDQVDQLTARLQGVKQTVSFSVVAPMNAASQTAVSMYDAMFSSPTQKMQSFENVAVSSIENIIGAIGFLYDAFKGIDLVLQTSKLGFMYLVKGIVEAFNVANELGNSAISMYNSLPESMRGEKIELIELRDVSVVNKEIDDTKKNIQDLYNTIGDGSSYSDKFLNEFRNSLNAINTANETDAKKQKNPEKTTTLFGSDANAHVEAYYNFLDEKEKEATALIVSDTDKINAKFMSMYDAIKDIWKTDDLEKFYKVWNKEVDDISKKQNESNTSDISAVGNRVTAYGALAGSMASLYEQGSNEAQNFKILQESLAIISGTIAILEQGKGDPYTAFARMATMAVSVASLLSGAGISGSASTGPSASQQASIVEQSENDLILDRLDRQIELLEQLNQAGTAGSARVEYSKLKYDTDILSLSNTIAKDFTRNTGSTSALYDDTQSTYKTKYDELFSSLGFDIFNEAKYRLNGEGTFKVRADDVAGDTQKTFDFLVYFNENRDVFNSLMSNMEDDLNRWINEAQQAIADYTTATLDSLSELTEASKKFKEISDSITMSDFYKSQDLQKANEDINKLLSGTGAKDLSDYLTNYITEIDKLNEYFTDDTYRLLMSQNINDLSAQTEKVNELNEILGTTYLTTAEDALNYIDSIELVGEALASSNENIKSWEDGFKSDYEKAQDLAKSFNVTLATSYSELDSLFETLKGGIEGLSDAELELLDANKALLEESSSALNDAFLGEYSPLSQMQKTQYASQIAENPDDYNMSAVDAAYLSLQEAAKTATRDEDIASQFNDYTTLLLEQQQDATRSDIVKELVLQQQTLNDVVDTLERIENANTSL